MLFRPIGKDDYAAVDSGNVVGRIRPVAERTNDVWMWHVTVLLASPSCGSARTIDAAKFAFRAAWTAFKALIPSGDHVSANAEPQLNKILDVSTLGYAIRSDVSRRSAMPALFGEDRTLSPSPGALVSPRPG